MLLHPHLHQIVHPLAVAAKHVGHWLWGYISWHEESKFVDCKKF